MTAALESTELGIDVEPETSTQRVDAANCISREDEPTIPTLGEDAESQPQLKPAPQVGPETVVRREARQEQMDKFFRSGRRLALDGKQPGALRVRRPPARRVALTVRPTRCASQQTRNLVRVEILPINAESKSARINETTNLSDDLSEDL